VAVLKERWRFINMRELTYTQALREALTEEMDRDPNILLLGEDIGLYGGVFKVTEGLLAKFGPERVRETPISEAGFVGMGVGLAMTGKRPVAELMFMDFAWVASDQIFNQAAKMRYMSGGRVKVPLLIRTQQGGGRGNGAQHSQSLETIFTHIPGLKVVLPATPYDAKGLLKTALRDDNPVIFIEHKLLYNTKGPVPEEEYAIPFGVADVKRSGRDVTVVSYSRTLLHALEAAEEAAKDGISAEVIDLRTTAPLDLETILASVRKTGRLIIAHEAHRRLGIGAEIASLVQEQAFDYLDAPIARVGAMDIPIPSSKPLEDVALPGKNQILQAIRQIVV
jgi:acetoin:2,6-dichlorophenolindophenol oxidoreductase subunit beta